MYANYFILLQGTAFSIISVFENTIMIILLKQLKLLIPPI